MRMTRRPGAVPLAVTAVLAVLDAAPAVAQDPKAELAAAIDAAADEYAAIARRIWSLAELGYMEEQSSALLHSRLEAAGFAVEAGVAGMPTAFVASYGEGRPVIGILAEYDALPGLSQDTVPKRKPLSQFGPGHACGHHLFGTASVAAAIAVKDWLARTGRPGTVRVYGTPAEEGGGGKVYMARAGLFADVDAVLHWHPASVNDASPSTSLANMSGKFRFYGIAAHASAAPEQGRSALDGVEAMNHMVNLMREHIAQESRIHYVITAGGQAPNVVPDFAEVYYYARHPDPAVVAQLWERIVKAAEGAALGTGTRVEVEVLNGVYSLLPNEALARVVDANLRHVGGIRYTETERAFAEALAATLEAGGEVSLMKASEIEPFRLSMGGASTDVGDVSWVVPTAGLNVATWVPGTPAHSWQAVAAGGTSIGMKGMVVAAKTLAMTVVDLLLDPSHIEAARAEFERRRGPNFVYRPLVGDREPPLDYRR